MAAQLKKSLKRKSREQSEFSRNSKKSLNKMESSGSVQSKAISLQLEDEVPDFPRGGGGALCHYEEEQIRAEVDAEFKEEQRGQKKLKKKKEKKNFLTDDDLGSLFGDGISGRLPRVANKVTLKNICPGMKLWGVIAEVNEKDLVISLPGGLRGLVRASEASDLSDNEIKDIESTILSRLFHVRDLVSCIVLQVEDNKKDEKGKRKIWLSMRLSLLHKGLTLDAIQEGMVLTAYVKSIEDHGYILHFGSSSFNGFLPIKDQGDSSDVKLNIGQLLQGVVRSIDKVRKVVYLISDPQAVSKSVTKDLKGISIDLLIPGMMVNARVQSTLENGILLSFLTYFTGTVDIFHLNNSFPGSDWKGDYSKNKRVNARILFIDPITRAVGLTLNPHLVSNKAPPSLVGAGEIYDHSRVVRVDRGLGLLLEIPSAPVATPAYVSIFDVADGEVQRLEKRFKEGSDVRVRILGFKHLEGLAMGLLKASAFEGSVFTHSDVKPGMVVKAKVIAVESFGAIVQFSSGVKALCPLPHMSEFDIAKPPKKFKVGAELVFRVLGCKSKRITVTHKKTLVKSKLGILSSYDDAADGFVTHGWITKIEKHGCFVRFYNGVQGFASRFELGLDPGCEASTMYHVGQVVKCRVINAIPASRRINLSFIISLKRVSEDDMIKPGSMVSGVVEQLTSHAIIVHVNSNGYSKGTLLTEHLADHQGYAALMKSILKPGHEFSKLLVLDVEGRNLILSAKYSLINSAEHLPLDLTQIQPQAVLHGYICNLIETGCFVRFLGRLTGFCPRNKATDDQIADLSEAFYIGQSVRSKILCADGGTGRITLSLKQSSCASSDASFLHGYFFLEQEIAKLQITNSKDSDLKWIERFSIGSVVEGVVQEAKEFGVVISFHDNIFGFITHYQMGGLDVEKGSPVRAAVLDISKAECLVDLTLKPEFICRCEEDSFNSLNKKKHRREACNDLEVHQTVNAIVEIVKENYLVLSVPECNYAIGYASLTDYNIQKLPQKKFVTGQSVVATIEELPSPLTTGRLLLLLKSEVTETSSSKRAKKKSSYSVGSLVQAEITDIKPLELRLKFGFGFHGRIHITEASEDNMVEDLFSMFKIGQLLTARIVSKTKQSGNNRRPYEWELSIRPKVLSGFLETEDGLVADYSKFSTGKYVTGYVVKVDTEWIWLTLSRHVMAQVFFLDISCEPSELQEFRKKFKVGRAVSGHILSINKDRNLIRLVLRPLSVRTHNFEMVKIDNTDSNSSNGNVMEHIQEGDVIGGRISRILPGVGGLLVQIGPHLYGKVHFTEIIDGWLSDPLSGYHEGQFVKCKVLEINQSIKGSILVDISLRVSFEPHNTVRDNNNERVENVEHLQPNMVVQGYVKNVSSKGCFIMLSRKVDAKILLSNLSEGYVLNPEKDFPVGKLVTGKVSSVEPLSKRVEVSLRTSSTDGALKSDMDDLSKLRIGDVICGTIKRIEPYGLFITIDGTNMVGLCHVSELSDDHIDNIESKYGAGERVTAKILKVDEDRHRISLGMKSSYMKDGASIYNLFNRGNNQTVDGNGATNNSQITVLQENASSLSQVSCSECENAGYPVLAQAESRASILPLDVTLDNMDGSDNDNAVIENQDHVTENSITERKRRQAKRKAKEARELEVRAAEERLLEKDIPQTEDEYEKLVRSSPNSSFIWIKYMAFMLSLADIEKARSIAERALRTINLREEAEKLNIWVAYLNLENEYGNPPEEAVMKTFQRALQYCDPKKVHLALLSMYERTGQYKLADELLDKMIKKFKYSCKVWLRRVECYLKQGRDGVQSIVNRALLSLPRNKHIKFISHVAILEFKCGVPDRGRSMFEGILREYPKRTDLWSIYLDQEIRLRDAEVIRALFERAISLSLPPKKMKFLFKKYLEYEKSCGDEERIESVKRKAMEYVESTLT